MGVEKRRARVLVVLYGGGDEGQLGEARASLQMQRRKLQTAAMSAEPLPIETVTAA